MPYQFSTGGPSTLPLGQARVFFDGVFSEPRLQHPEGIAIGPDGWIWCGSENGQVLRVSPDGSCMEEVAVIGGFTLGLAFDGSRALFACEQKTAAVYRIDLGDRSVHRFTTADIRIPNYPVVDARRGRLLVSDSYGFQQSGPGVWTFDLDTGHGGLWYGAPLDFANGMALTPDGNALLVCETFSRRISRIEIEPDGSAGASSPFAEDLPGLPDGVALDNLGQVFVGCYEPSRILRLGPDGSSCEVYIEDPTAHLFAHPTNIAFDGPALYSANLGRWHITRVETDTEGRRLVDVVTELRQ